jgi:serine phosphatase RsbU (regulator of sigma subunit)/predicted ester cyclase
MSTEENKVLVRRFLRAQNEGDMAALAKMMSPDFVDRSVLPGQGHTREDYIRGVAEDQAAFSDARLIIEDQVAEGDKVISRLTVRGAHDRGEFAGMAPTGTDVETTAITINRVAGGRIVEEWSEGGGMYELTQQRLEQELRERERIEEDLRVARRIQQALLPKELPRLDGWEVAPLYHPAREVGGDFYDFLPLADGRVGLVIGDVSGKGIAAALVMANTQSILRAIARTSPAPGQLLAQANEVLWSYIPPNVFATCFCGVLDPDSGRLTYANAGHNPPCHRHRGDATELWATGMPLGLMPGMTYEEKEAVLAPGDGILFYSDGLVEAHNPEREMLGSPRLRSLLSQRAGRAAGAKALAASVMEALRRFTGEGWEQEDDITLVTLQRVSSRSETRAMNADSGAKTEPRLDRAEEPDLRTPRHRAGGAP